MSTTTVAAAATNGSNDSNKTKEQLQQDYSRNPAVAAAFNTNHSRLPFTYSDAIPAVGFPSAKHLSSGAPIPALFPAADHSLRNAQESYRSVAHVHVLVQ